MLGYLNRNRGSIRQNIYTKKMFGVLDKCNCRQKDYSIIGQIDCPVTIQVQSKIVNHIIKVVKLLTTTGFAPHPPYHQWELQ